MRPALRRVLTNDLRESAEERATVLEQTRITRERLVKLQTADDRRTGRDRRWHERRVVKR